VVGSDPEPPVLVQRIPTVISERFGDETLVLEPTRDQFTRLNANGSRLWELLDGPVALSELRQVLARACHLDALRAQADVDAFISSLVQRGLLELRPAARPE
jgi:hypothetical protein